MNTYMRAAVIAALVGASVSCGDVVRSSRTPVLVTVAQLQGAPTGGFGANTFSSVLFSDVEVLVTTPAPCSPTAPCPTIYADLGQATISTSMKNTAVSPTANNLVTLNRYHVEFRRADGRNVEGVDVPRSFDGAVTASISPNATSAVSFELVRHVAKKEAPLAQLVNSRNNLATIAVVTFYGTDAVGNVVSASGQLSVNFGDFGDQ